MEGHVLVQREPLLGPLDGSTNGSDFGHLDEPLSTSRAEGSSS